MSEIAECIPISEDHLNGILNGSVHPDLETLIDICNIANIDIAEMIETVLSNYSYDGSLKSNCSKEEVEEKTKIALESLPKDLQEELSDL